jgi:hypothetical protein
MFNYGVMVLYIREKLYAGGGASKGGIFVTLLNRVILTLVT